MRQWNKAFKAAIQAGDVNLEEFPEPPLETVEPYKPTNISFDEYLNAEEYVHLGRPMVVKFFSCLLAHRTTGDEGA